jgi:hypothetical protein
MPHSRGTGPSRTARRRHAVIWRFGQRAGASVDEAVGITKSTHGSPINLPLFVVPHRVPPVPPACPIRLTHTVTLGTPRQRRPPKATSSLRHVNPGIAGALCILFPS